MADSVVDTIVRHTVGGDRAALTSFPMRPFFGGCQVSGPWATDDEDRWMLILSHSISGDLGRDTIEAECVRSGIEYVRRDAEHVYRETATNDSDGAIKRGVGIAGATYVSVRCDGHGELGKVLLKSRKRCNHTHTMCVDCVEMWELDHEVRFQATEGGRKLAARRAEFRSRRPGLPPIG